MQNTQDVPKAVPFPLCWCVLLLLHTINPSFSPATLHLILVWQLQKLAPQFAAFFHLLLHGLTQQIHTSSIFMVTVTQWKNNLQRFKNQPLPLQLLDSGWFQCLCLQRRQKTRHETHLNVTGTTKKSDLFARFPNNASAASRCLAQLTSLWWRDTCKTPGRSAPGGYGWHGVRHRVQVSPEVSFDVRQPRCRPLITVVSRRISRHPSQRAHSGGLWAPAGRREEGGRAAE